MIMLLPPPFVSDIDFAAYWNHLGNVALPMRLRKFIGYTDFCLLDYFTLKLLTKFSLNVVVGV
jgi:hypothetical protein